jgi:hypothetical protein
MRAGENHHPGTDAYVVPDLDSACRVKEHLLADPRSAPNAQLVFVIALEDGAVPT